MGRRPIDREIALFLTDPIGACQQQ
jgi:hypothetical protein